jgi:hypothetical protein
MQPQMLEYSETEHDPFRAASRLGTALKRKIGHVTIIGEDQEDTNLFVSIVLEEISGYQFLNISARTLDINDMPVPSEDTRAIAVIYNADVLTVETLEQLRLWTEYSYRGITLVLVGTSKLAATLADPALKLLTQVVHTRVTLARPRFVAEEATKPIAHLALRSSLLAAAAAAGYMAWAISTQGVPPPPALTAMANFAVTTAEWVRTQVPAALDWATVPEKLGLEVPFKARAMKAVSEPAGEQQAAPGIRQISN